MIGYQGHDRRRHRFYVTRNREYHLRDRECVGVRDCRSGDWLDSHPAVGRELYAALSASPTGTAVSEVPEVGSRLWFEQRGTNVLTTAVHAVGRPQREVVESYGT